MILRYYETKILTEQMGYLFFLLNLRKRLQKKGKFIADKRKE